MVKQLITIKPDGSMEGLQVKPGKGLNLQSFGNADTVRATDIIWDQVKQAWCIKILIGRYRGQYLTYQLFESETKNKFNKSLEKMIFLNYDQAVDYEILFLNSVRRNYGTL